MSDKPLTQTTRFPLEKLEAAEHDAARYRWLREHQDCLPDLSACSQRVQAGTLDAFIDAEMSRDREFARAKLAD